jgi:uncharacterized membrane protein
MEILIYLGIWYVIGFVSAAIAIKLDEGVFTLRDIVGCFWAGFLGLITPIFCLIAFILCFYVENKDKKLF